MQYGDSRVFVGGLEITTRTPNRCLFGCVLLWMEPLLLGPGWLSSFRLLGRWPCYGFCRSFPGDSLSGMVGWWWISGVVLVKKLTRLFSRSCLWLVVRFLSGCLWDSRRIFSEKAFSLTKFSRVIYQLRSFSECHNWRQYFRKLCTF